MKTIDDKIAGIISALEMELAGIANHPVHYDLNKVVAGPFKVTKIWFDLLDDHPTLGVTYKEKSAKDGKERDIFRAVRIGVALAVVQVWADNLHLLLGMILKHKDHKINLSSIEELHQELLKQ